ncbi:hypothetical protein CHKEEEPN_3202 [Methylorubrum podarium]|nr:hypothetical protein CHKEEEPN_3202 [Methylorubrum podarium]
MAARPSSFGLPERPTSTMRFAPRSASQRAASMPKPPRPPVTRWTPLSLTAKALRRTRATEPGAGGVTTILPTCPDCCMRRKASEVSSAANGW